MADSPQRSSDNETPGKPGGMTEEELAERPLAFRDNLLAGSTFLVSGGGSGIGRAIAYACARLGANVMICGRDGSKLEETRKGILGRIGREIATVPMAVRDPHAVKSLIDATYKRFGALDTLVNIGGGQLAQAAIDFSVKGWLSAIDTNVNGTWYMMQAAAQRWRDLARPGNIVNIVANVSPGMPQVAHMCAARAGVIYMSKTVSTEWAPLGIRVNCVSPGEAFDVAQAVVYLSAPTAKFITGDVLVVDGGSNQLGDVRPAGRPDYFMVPDC